MAAVCRYTMNCMCWYYNQLNVHQRQGVATDVPVVKRFIANNEQRLEQQQRRSREGWCSGASISPTVVCKSISSIVRVYHQ